MQFNLLKLNDQYAIYKYFLNLILNKLYPYFISNYLLYFVYH